MEHIKIPDDPIERKKTFEQIIFESSKTAHDFLHSAGICVQENNLIKADVFAKGARMFLNQVISSIEELKK